jgi:hypothetical protein
LLPPGYAQKVADTLAAIISDVNEAHNLSLYPVTLTNVLERVPEGKSLLEQVDLAKDTLIKAEAAVDIVLTASRANKVSVAGCWRCRTV